MCVCVCVCELETINNYFTLLTTHDHVTIILHSVVIHYLNRLSELQSNKYNDIVSTM